MKRSARVLFSVGKLFLLSLVFLLLSVSLSSSANAQSTPLNVNPDVPDDQHTRSQVILIENTSALICQLAGIDLMHPERGCLGIDTTTNKIGYAPKTDSTEPRIGGLLGMSTGLMGSLYTPPASGVSYLAGLVDNFGIVKKSYAQEETSELSGFDALSPVQQVWEMSRNLTYIILVIVFVVIGIGIMLRVKIDPRTSMTIQNQIPRIIVAILLITFSYSIIGFMVDVMWLTTYVGINTISAGTSKPICQNGTDPELSVEEGAYVNLLNYPLVFMNDIFRSQGGGGSENCQMGVTYITTSVANVIGDILNQIIRDIFDPGSEGCAFTDPSSWAGCILGGVLGWVGRIFGFLVAFLAIIIVMFRLWWQLLKAYAYIIIYTILGPFWILLGLLPNATLSFNAWMRTITAKLMAFPAAAFFILLAKVVLDAYSFPETTGNPQMQFVPPLVGNPNMSAFGPLLAFGILLITPEVLNMLNDALKAPASKYTGPAIAKGITGGVAPIAAGGGLLAARAFRKGNPFTGTSEGFARQWLKGEATYDVDPATGEKKIPRTKFAALRAKLIRPLLGEPAKH